MNKEKSPQNNTRLIPVKYTPEQKQQMDEDAKKFVEALNSSVND